MALLKIEEILNNKSITPSFLVDKYGFESYNGEHTTRVSSAPSTVKLYDAEFIAQIFYAIRMANTVAAISCTANGRDRDIQ